MQSSSSSRIDSRTSASPFSTSAARTAATSELASVPTASSADAGASTASSAAVGDESVSEAVPPHDATASAAAATRARPICGAVFTKDVGMVAPLSPCSSSDIPTLVGDRPTRGLVMPGAPTQHNGRACARPCGAPVGTRTPNLLIRSQMLYPLSYRRFGRKCTSCLPQSVPRTELRWAPCNR